MADPQWPSNLPLPLWEGYQVDDTPPVVRTQMESGPARVTRIATAFPTSFTVNLILDPYQFATLMSFWDRTANAGADWFGMPLDSIGGVEYHRVRFVGGVSRTKPRGDLYAVNFSVETEDRVPVYE